MVELSRADLGRVGGMRGVTSVAQWKRAVACEPLRALRNGSEGACGLWRAASADPARGLHASVLRALVTEGDLWTVFRSGDLL